MEPYKKHIITAFCFVFHQKKSAADAHRIIYFMRKCDHMMKML